MITTLNRVLAEQIRTIRNHGRKETEGVSEFLVCGYNYRMSELAAAVGLVQLRTLDRCLERRRAAAAGYIKALSTCNGVELPLSGLIDECSFQSFVILLDDSISRDKIIKHLRERNIETTIGTYAMHAQPAFRRFNYRPGQLENSWAAQQRSVALPLFNGITDEQVGQVCEAVKDVLN